MARKFSEHNKWTIPSDWNEERDGYMCYVMCVPNSRQWRGIFDGQISDLAYGRNWNKHTGSIIDNQFIAREVFESMCAARCDEIIAQITLIAEGVIELGDKTGTTGQEVEVQQSDGVVTVGEGEQFPDQASYFDAKCNVANGVYDTILGAVTWLDDNNVDLLLGLFGGVTSGLIAGLIGAGPMGWAVILTASTIAGLAGFISRYAISFSDLKAALIDTHSEAVLALYNASDTLTAEDNFITEVEAGTPPITSIESGVLALLLTSDMLNNLFSPREDMSGYQSASPIDCGSALLASWTFPVDVEGWTFRDDSAGASTASGAYNGPGQALEITMNNAGGGSKPISKGTWLETGLSISVPIGGSIQFDYSAPSDSINQSKHVKVIYSDLTSNTHTVTGGTGAGTLVMTFPSAKTVEEIECSISRTTSLTNTHTSDIEEVRVFGL